MRKAWWPLAALLAVGVAAALRWAPVDDGERAVLTPAALERVATPATPPALVAAAEPGALHAAFLAALREPPSEERAARLRTAYVRWLLDAPEQALAGSAGLPVEERRQVMTAALAALAVRHPAVFERYAGMLAGYGTDLPSVAGAMADENPAFALDWVRRHPALDRDGQLTAAVVPALVRSNPAFAASAVAAMKDRAPLALVQQVATAYARTDPAQAYAWVRQVMVDRKDAAPARLLADVSGSLVAADPQAAEQFMRQAPDPDVRASLMGELANRKGEEDLGAAWSWLGQYGADASYADVAQDLLYRWSWVRPAEVARILPRIDDPAVQAGAVGRLTQMWQRKDPAAYEAWLASLPSGPLRNAALAAR